MPRIEPVPWEELSQEKRDRFEAGVKSGKNQNRVTHAILAYADHDADAVPDDGDRHPNFPESLLEGKLIELVRIRSAQLGGCDPCKAARKVKSADEEAVACLISPELRGDLTDRQRLAIELLERLDADHHGIDDAFFRRLAEHFTTAEIIELGQICGTTLGMHRWLHTLDFFGNGEPVIRYDADQRGVGWAGLQQRKASNRQTQEA